MLPEYLNFIVSDVKDIRLEEYICRYDERNENGYYKDKEGVYKVEDVKDNEKYRLKPLPESIIKLYNKDKELCNVLIVRTERGSMSNGIRTDIKYELWNYLLTYKKVFVILRECKEYREYEDERILLQKLKEEDGSKCYELYRIIGFGPKNDRTVVLFRKKDLDNFTHDYSDDNEYSYLYYKNKKLMTYNKYLHDEGYLTNLKEKLSYILEHRPLPVIGSTHISIDFNKFDHFCNDFTPRYRGGHPNGIEIGYESDEED